MRPLDCRCFVPSAPYTVQPKPMSLPVCSAAMSAPSGEMLGQGELVAVGTRWRLAGGHGRNTQVVGVVEPQALGDLAARLGAVGDEGDARGLG